MGWMETVTQAVTQEGGAVSRSCWSSSSSHNNEQCKMLLEKEVCIGSRPSQLAKLYRREFDPELLSDPCRGSDLETAFWLLTCNLRRPHVTSAILFFHLGLSSDSINSTHAAVLPHDRVACP